MMGSDRRLRRRGWSVCVAIAALAALAPAGAAVWAASSANTSTRIIPGESIGPIHLGMRESDADSAMGPSTAQSPARRVYPRFGLVLDFDGGKVVRIATASSKYRTAQGAGVGTAAGDAARLVGDDNSVTTISGEQTTVVYMFQGVGFVFRAGGAVETFVVAAMQFGPPKTSVIVQVSPGGPPVYFPGGPPGPPAGTGVPAGPGSTGRPAASPPPNAALRDLAAGVLSIGGLTVTGVVANTGISPVGPLIVTATFTRASGDQVDVKTMIQGPLPPGGSAPFALQAAMVADVIIRYQVSVTSETGALAATTSAQAIPPSAYAEFAQRQVHIKVDLGAPSQMTGPPKVQVLVSIADTGAIPASWVQQVTVSVPYTFNGSPGAATAELLPGQMQTVLVPAGATLGAPQVTGVVLSGQ